MSKSVVAILLLIGGILGLGALADLNLALFVALIVLFFIFGKEILYWLIAIVAVSWAFIVAFSFQTFFWLWVAIIFFAFLTGYDGD